MYTEERKEWLTALQIWKKGDPLPPCPNCGGNTMESWDCWLVTGETCKKCGWSDSEGFS